MASLRAFALRCIHSTTKQANTRLLWHLPCPKLHNFSQSLGAAFHSGGVLHYARPAPPCIRLYSQTATAVPQPPEYLNEAELHIFEKIRATLNPVKLEVQDISGGCGSMYAIEIESTKFQGLTMIKQHKMVNEILKEEIAKWHGVQLRTKAV
ncbi:hypothetical protein ACN47E_007521 [Coniothyrium glycines]